VLSLLLLGSFSSSSSSYTSNTAILLLTMILKIKIQIIELKETNFMINSNNPKEILKNGYVMLVDADTNKMIKSGIDLSLLKDLSDIENTDKKSWCTKTGPI